MLQVREVVKAYDGRAVVDHVSFEVAPGEIFALLGPNGAGKTTLIRMVTDILRPDAGEVLWEGRPSRERGRNAVAYLPEERGLYRRSRVVEAIAFHGELKGMTSRDARAAARRLLERVELGEWAERQVQALSKGMQQKVQLCTALIGEPKLLILDEPFSGLDPVNVRLLEEILHEARQGGATVLLSTHQMNKVEELCDRAMMIHHGRMVLYGPVAELRRQHAGHAVVLRTPSTVPAVPGVRAVESRNGEQLLTLEPDATPQAVLHALIHQGLEIESFGVATLPLEDVFVKVVRESVEAAPVRAGSRV
jgi:ABC-2 type transport system ATP-binding protein